MKKTIWAFTEDLNNYPSPQIWSVGFPQGKMDIMVFPLYVALWGIATRALYIPQKNGVPILYGFIAGIIFLIFYHIWAFGNLFGGIGDDTGFVLMDTDTKKHDSKSLATYESDTSDKILFKSPYNAFLKKNKNLGVVLDAEKYKEYKKQGKIKDASFDEWVMKGGNKAGKVRDDIYDRAELLGEVSYYLIIILFSLTILVAQSNIKTFEMMFPWIILSTFFTLIQATSWIWIQNDAMGRHIFLYKRHLFVLGASFCLTAILIVLKFNNK